MNSYNKDLDWHCAFTLSSDISTGGKLKSAWESCIHDADTDICVQEHYMTKKKYKILRFRFDCAHVILCSLSIRVSEHA